MTGKKESDTTWHPMTVLLRGDIYRQACEQGIDINDACNRALAGLTGTEYHGQPGEGARVPAPVIIARPGSPPAGIRERKKSPSEKLHPVINADDPAAPANVVQAKAQPLKKVPATPPVPISADVLPEEKPVAAPAAITKKAADKKDHTAASKKRPKRDTLKTFVSSKIARTDDAGDHIGKDELYELFARFCHDHRITPVPERKAVTVALKNQFALMEKRVDGISSWTGIRLK